MIETDCPETEGLIARAQKATDQSDRPDQKYYRLIDEIVDSYLPITDKLSETLDHLEDEALADPTPQTLSTIFETKRTLILLRRVMVNTRDVATHLQRTESPFIARDMWPFLRDVYDHVARNLDTVEVLRDLLNGSLDVYLSSVANRTNQVMKVLTVLGTIALPTHCGFGNLWDEREGAAGAESPYGLAAVFAIIVGTTAFLLWILKRFGWF